MQLTIFYDSHCPLCMMEMQHLKKCDLENRIKLVDLHTNELEQLYPHIDKELAMKKLHAQMDSGEKIYGLDVTCKAWTLVGKYRWLSVLRLPLIKPIADLMYRFFARYRGTLAFLITGKKHCDSNQCKI